MGLTSEGLVRIPGFSSRWARLGNGAKAHYMSSGEEGPSVVLLHGGIPGSSGLAGWRFMAPFLGANGFRVYCPDLPGFGLSDNRPEYAPVNGVLDAIDFVDRFADALCLDEFYLAGNSLGCMNVAHYVVRYPHRVKAFALIAGGIGDILPMELEKELRVPIKQDSDMATMMSSIILNSSAIDDDLIAMRELAAARNADAWAHVYRNVLLGQVDPDVAVALSTAHRLDRLSIPGIYIYGVDDVLIPVDPIGYCQEDALSTVQFFYPENTGHQGQTDQPELFNQVFLEFFRDGTVSRATADRAGVSKRRPELPSLVQRSPIGLAEAAAGRPA